MELIIYTTYLTAMRHPESLTACGDERTAEAGRMGELKEVTGARRWLGAFLIRLRLRHWDAESRSADTGGTIAAARPGARASDCLGLTATRARDRGAATLLKFPKFPKFAAPSLRGGQGDALAPAPNLPQMVVWASTSHH